MFIKSIMLQREHSYMSRIEDMGVLKGRIEFADGKGAEFTTQISAEKTAKIVEILADTLVDHAQALGATLRQGVIDAEQSLLKLPSSEVTDV